MTLLQDRPARPASNPSDCRHSRAAFDAAFVAVGERRDLSDAAKRLHAALISMVRQGLRWTQAQLAAHLGWRKRQKVWRATSELIGAGLVRMRRIGLGKPNAYELVETDGLMAEDIAGKAPRCDVFRSGHQEGRRPNVPTRARHSGQKEETKKPDRYTGGRLAAYIRT